MRRQAPPITLCYHAVSSAWLTPLAVSPAQLERQLRHYAHRGFTALTFSEAERRRQTGSLPPKTLVVTFDDAFASILEARPILTELGFPATVFVVGEFLDGERPLDWPGVGEWIETEHRDELRSLRVADLQDLQNDGWEIGSHTMTHPLLPTLDPDTCLRELVESRELLTERFGSCTTLAYPYGAANSRVAGLARRAGYQAACTLTKSLRHDEPLLRPRLAVSGPDTPLRAWIKMSPAGVWLRRRLPTGLAERL